MVKKKEDIIKNLEGKGLNDLTQNINSDKEENSDLEELSQELLDNRDYDKYDYYEIDMKKGSTKSHAIMFFLYLIIIALIVITIVFYKYKDQYKQNDYSKVDNYEIENKL